MILLYELANFLHNIIKSSISESSFDKNSYHLVNKLNGIMLNLDHEFASLNVISLFTNVLSESVFERYLNFHSQHPLSHKKGIIYGGQNIAFISSSVSSKKFIRVNIFNNCYPIIFYFCHHMI